MMMMIRCLVCPSLFIYSITVFIIILLGSVGTILVIAAITFVILNSKYAIVAAGPITPARPKGITAAKPKQGITPAKPKPKTSNPVGSGGGVGGPSTQAKKDAAENKQAERNIQARQNRITPAAPNAITPATALEGITAARRKLTIPPLPRVSQATKNNICQNISGGYVSGTGCKSELNGSIISDHELFKSYYRDKLSAQAESIVGTYREMALQAVTKANGYSSKEQFRAQDPTNSWKLDHVVNVYRVVKIKMINDALRTIGVTPITTLDKKKFPSPRATIAPPNERGVAV